MGFIIRNGIAYGDSTGVAEVYLGSQTIASGSESYEIANSEIKETSLIDIYYAESSKETVQTAGVTYAQVDGTLTLTFGSALGAEVTISNVKVVNV